MSDNLDPLNQPPATVVKSIVFSIGAIVGCIALINLVTTFLKEKDSDPSGNANAPFEISAEQPFQIGPLQPGLSRKQVSDLTGGVCPPAARDTTCWLNDNFRVDFSSANRVKQVAMSLPLPATPEVIVAEFQAALGEPDHSSSGEFNPPGSGHLNMQCVTWADVKLDRRLMLDFTTGTNAYGETADGVLIAIGFRADQSIACKR